MKDRELKKINFFERERSVNEKKSVRERMKFLYTLNACEFSRSPFFSCHMQIKSNNEM